MNQINEQIFIDNEDNTERLRHMPIARIREMLAQMTLTQLLTNYTFLLRRINLQGVNLVDEEFLAKLRRNEKVQFNRIRDIERFQDSLLWMITSYTFESSLHTVLDQVLSILILGLNLIIHRNPEFSDFDFIRILKWVVYHDLYLYPSLVKILGNCITAVINHKMIYLFLCGGPKYERIFDNPGVTDISIIDRKDLLLLFLGKASFKILAPLAFGLYQYSLNFILETGDPDPDLIRHELTLETLERIIGRDRRTKRDFRRYMLGRTEFLVRDPKFPGYLSRGRVDDIEL